MKKAQKRIMEAGLKALGNKEVFKEIVNLYVKTEITVWEGSRHFNVFFDCKESNDTDCINHYYFQKNDQKSIERMFKCEVINGHQIDKHPELNKLSLIFNVVDIADPVIRELTDKGLLKLIKKNNNIRKQLDRLKFQIKHNTEKLNRLSANLEENVLEFVRKSGMRIEDDIIDKDEIVARIKAGEKLI